MRKNAPAAAAAQEAESNLGGRREGAGRPALENPRNIPYQLRLTQDERDKLDRIADAAGMKAADWLRERIRLAREPK